MRIVIIGCGRVGAGLAGALTLEGHTLAIVDRDPAAFQRLGTAFAGTTVSGVGFDREVLLRAGIERADGLAAVTGSDEANVLIARVAGQVFRVPRVVARLYDPGKADVYRRLGLQTIAPVTWGVHRIAELLTFSQLDVRLSLGSGEVDIVETDVPPLLIGRRVHDVTVPGEIHVVAITRDGRAFLPALGSIFEDGDLLHVAVAAASAGRLDGLLAHR